MAMTREAKKAATREALIDAAARLFAARGVERTTIEEIAHAAGTSRTSVFNYFGYKEMILCEIGARFVSEVAQTALSKRYRTPRAMLLALADAVADLARREPELIAAVAREMTHTDPERRRCAIETMRYYELVDAVFDRLADAGLLRHPRRRATHARQLVDMTTGMLVRAGGDFPMEELRGELRANVDLFMEGAVLPG